MVYNGFFRDSKDNTPYKVVIFTDGKQYQYRPYPTDTGFKIVPVAPVEITLTDTPFTVEYASEVEDIYKPYKCCTATVGIIADTYNTNLRATKRNEILVVLLKQKEDVVESNGYYENTTTGAKLYKKRTEALVDGVIKVIYNDYEPQALDNFLYSVEWVGFATPNTYNQPFNLVKEPFNLECQDALSTLQYFDYTRLTDGINCFEDCIKGLLTKVGNIYKNIYITNTIRVADSVSNRSILSRLYELEDNFFNEDNEPQDALTVLGELMKYINCTVVPYKDSLYIINYDAVRNHRNYYYTLTRDGNNISTDTTNTYYNGGLTLIDEPIINIDSTFFAGANTTLSTTNTYKKVKVVTDEYYISNIIADIDNENDYTDNYQWDANRQVKKRNGNTYTVTNVNFAGRLLEPVNDKNYTTTCYTYPKDILDSRETPTGGNTHFTTWYITDQTQYPTDLNSLLSTVGCTPVEYSINEIENIQDAYSSYNGKRAYFFHLATHYYSATNISNGWQPYALTLSGFTGTQPANNYIQPLITFTSKPIYIKMGQYLNLRGNWTYHTGNAEPYNSGWTTDQDTTLTSIINMRFIWAKVSVNCNGVVKWLANEGQSTSQNINVNYIWSDTEQWVKLWHNLEVTVPNNINAFDNTFSFFKNTRGIEGTSIELPTFNNSGAYATIEVTFNRPVGSCRGNTNYNFIPATTCMLEDFDIKVVDKSETEYITKEQKDNNEFSVNLDGEALDEYSQINLLLSSNYNKATNYSTVSVDKDKAVQRINNTNTGKVDIAEAVIVDSIATHYKAPNIVLNVDTHRELTPISLLTWANQFGGSKFIVAGFTKDYGNNITSATLEEKDNITEYPTIYYNNKVKNYRRNGDNLYNELVKTTKKPLTTPNPTIIPTVNFGNIDGEVMVTDDTNSTLLKDLYFEPYFYDGEIYLYIPSYLEDNVTANIDNNGVLRINYDI